MGARGERYYAYPLGELLVGIQELDAVDGAIGRKIDSARLSSTSRRCGSADRRTTSP